MVNVKNRHIRAYGSNLLFKPLWIQIENVLAMPSHTSISDSYPRQDNIFGYEL